MNKEQKIFILGASCAIATIVRGHGCGTECEEAFRACIGTWDAFINANPDEYDINILSPHFKPAT